MNQASVPQTLRRAGWTWTEKGLLVNIATDEGSYRVHVPLHHVEIIFDDATHSVGCPLDYSVGAPGTVGGFFKRIGRGLKKFGKKIGKGLKKAVHAVSKVAKAIVTSPIVRAGLAAVATAFPIAAPLAAGVETAARVIKAVDKGAKAAKQIADAGKAGAKMLSKGKRDKLRREVRTAKKDLAGIKRLGTLARGGDPRAKRAMGALTTALAVYNSR